MTSGASEYRGDVDDPRYDGWSYLGDRYRCPLADDELSCHHEANRLRTEQREDELRAMVVRGHRCAFVRLMELLVEADRVDDLRAMALAGDERAGVTLAEYWTRRSDEAALRDEIAVLPRSAGWLAGMLAQQGRLDEAAQVLRELVANADADPRHRDEALSLLKQLERRGAL
jgi:hypothetical protein